MCDEDLINKSSKAKFCEECRIKRNKELDRQSELRKQARRKKEIGIKYCAMCLAVIESSRRVLFCVECRPIADKERARRGKRKRSLIKKRQDRIELSENFKVVNPEGEYLLPINFDKVSDISSATYTQKIPGGWSSILKRYGKFEAFKEYIVDEYINWSEETECRTVGDFYSEIGVSGTLMDQFLLGNELRELAGYGKFSGFTDEEYEKEFYRTMSCFENVPIWTEFQEEIKISLYSYARYFKISGDVYVQVLQKYSVPQDDIEDMLGRISKLKGDRAREHLTGVYQISEEDLIEDFKQVFDDYLAKYDRSPTIQEYDRLAKYGKTTIVGRLGMRYSEIAQSLGYYVNNSGSLTEHVTLENMKSILKCDYKSQATFDWLRSDLNSKLLCDGYFEDIKLIVEYDGRQHTEMIEFFGQESFDRTQLNDAVKNKLIPQHGITLLRIAYNEPYHDEDFLRMRLFEHGIIPPNHTLISDSQSQQSKIA